MHLTPPLTRIGQPVGSLDALVGGVVSPRRLPCSDTWPRACATACHVASLPPEKRCPLPRRWRPGSAVVWRLPFMVLLRHTSRQALALAHHRSQCAVAEMWRLRGVKWCPAAQYHSELAEQTPETHPMSTAKILSISGTSSSSCDGPAPLHTPAFQHHRASHCSMSEARAKRSATLPTTHSASTSPSTRATFVFQQSGVTNAPAPRVALPRFVEIGNIVTNWSAIGGYRVMIRRRS